MRRQASVLLLGIALSVTGCDGGNSAPSARPTATGTDTKAPATTPATPPPTTHRPDELLCAPSNTRIVYDMTQGAAGTTIVEFRVINTGEKPCHTYGFPGYQFFGTSGRKLPTHVERDTHSRPKHLLLAPGETAHLRFNYFSAAPRCGNHGGAPVDSVAITLPDNEASERINPRDNITPCRGHISTEPIADE